MTVPGLAVPSADERNPFRGKGLGVTLALLLEPRRPWTLAELAFRAQVSRPMVTKVVESLRRRGLVTGDVHQGRRAAIRPTPDLFTATAVHWPRPALWIMGGTVPTALPTGGGNPISAALGIPWDSQPRVYVRSRAMIRKVRAFHGGFLVSEPVGEWGITIVDFPLEPGPLPPLVAALELGDTSRGRQTLDDHAHAIAGSFADDPAAMTTDMPPTIVVPPPVAETLARLADAVGSEVVLVGGWAVACRLRMARYPVRPTEDLDVLLRDEARPARAALAAISAVQADGAHPCRVSGLPLTLDLLADGDDEFVNDPDGLRLLVPPFASLLVRTAQPVRLVDAKEHMEATVSLPLAGALFATKVANVAFDFRDRPKRASDAEDALRLFNAFGTLGLLNDLVHAAEPERRELRRHLGALGAGGLAGPAREREYYGTGESELEAGIAGMLANLA